MQVKGAYDGQELGFHDGWFPKLKGMSLTDMEHITRIYKEKGALICLEYLKLDGLKELVSVPDGMEFLSSIQDVIAACSLVSDRICKKALKRED